MTRRRTRHPSPRAVLLGLASALMLVPQLGAQAVDPASYASLRARHIGPIGNRVSAVAGITGDPLTYYVGAASGGVWKTTDAGITWNPIFDDQDSHSIGALVVSASDPNVVWVGTGEAHIRSNVSLGDGVYRSTDGGRSWRNMGLEATGRISDVVIHPTNPDLVYVAALGHAHGPQTERGIYRTMDGGETWEHLLFIDENTGASALVMAADNPRILFAGTWQIVVNTWNRESGGPGSGLHMSRDGGDTWTRLEGSELPRLDHGKVGLCVTPADPDRIYALIETGDGIPWHGQETESGELWRSDDGGGSWQLVSHDRNLAGRTAYYSACAVAPDNPDEAYFLTAPFVRTIDGGRTNEVQGGARRPGGDHHKMWIDPTDGDRMIVGHDGGLSISQNRGASWNRIQLPIAQMYHVTVDNAVPYNVMGNRQDGPSARGPSNSRTGGFGGNSIPRGAWRSVGGGESGFATPDPEDPDIVWSSASGFGPAGGIAIRYSARTGQFRHVEVWPESTVGVPAEEMRYRFQWTFPLVISPHDNNTIYVTSQHVHRTTNGGQSWEVISPDLTTNDPSRQGISGGLTPDNLGVEFCCVIYAFDESPAQPGVFYVGTNDGLVQVSRDGGQSWTDVTANLPDLPSDGVVRNVDASKWDAGRAYLTVEHHQVGNFDPHVYRTEDFGASWTKIVDGIPPGPLSFARNIREDPVRRGLLYLGTENALYVSFDDGGSWLPLRNNLPPAPMYWLQVQEHFNDLVIGTYGRGFWIMDDITPLQQLTPDVMASGSHLFEPRNAYRFHNVTNPMAASGDPADGENPEYGASLNYWLGQVPEGAVELRISDAAGTVVRTLEGTTSEGINRVYWDLRAEPSTQIKLRTTPLYADWVDLGPERWRPAPRGTSISTLSPPGEYTVTLVVDGQESSRTLTVLKDPNSEGSQDDILAQNALVVALRDELSEAAEMVNRIEWTRRQLYDTRAVLEDQDEGDNSELLEAAEALDQSLIAVEESLIQLRSTGTGQDYVRWPAKLVSRLEYLAGVVQVSDFPPTDEARQVHEVLQGRLEDARAQLDAVLEGDLAEFNRMLQQAGRASIITDGP